MKKYWKAKKAKKSGESKVVSEIKKSMESHLVVAALIATVTFAAGFTLPGGYVQNGSNNQGMAVLSLPTNGTKGRDRDMTTAVRNNFKHFLLADSIAFFLSMAAIYFLFLPAYHYKDKNIVVIYLWGFYLTGAAMLAMLYAFSQGLKAVLYPISLEVDINNIHAVVWSLVGLTIALTFYPSPRHILYRKRYESLMHQCKSP